MFKGWNISLKIKQYFSFKANTVGSIKDRKKFFKQKLYGFKCTVKLDKKNFVYFFFYQIKD